MPHGVCQLCVRNAVTSEFPLKTGNVSNPKNDEMQQYPARPDELPRAKSKYPVPWMPASLPPGSTAEYSSTTPAWVTARRQP